MISTLVQWCSNWNTSNLKYVFEIGLHLMYFAFCYLDKSNLYFVTEIGLHLVCAFFWNSNTFLCKILKVTENNTSAGYIRFNAVLGIMFQPVFSLFTVHWSVTVTVPIPSVEMIIFIFLLFIKRILIDLLARTPECILYLFSITFLRNILYFGLLVQSNWQK